jgi:hydroxymethylbilane synthase
VTDRLVIATRGSALALWQAEHVKARLEATRPGLAVELLTLSTAGDRILDVALAAIGGKALFVKEIEQALLDGRAHVAVHSMKDLPAELAPGLALAAVSSREDPRDAIVSPHGALAALPAGAVLGTSSLRRQCQLLAHRPDLQIKLLRGNVPTRVGKLDDGDYDAIVLAAAGLTRLGLADRITEALPIEVCLPAVAQGVLAIETRADDADTMALVREALHDPTEADRIAAERSFLAAMGGSCQTPLAAHALLDGGALELRALCGTPDGTTVLRATARGPRTEAVALGERAAADRSWRPAPARSSPPAARDRRRYRSASITAASTPKLCAAAGRLLRCRCARPGPRDHAPRRWLRRGDGQSSPGQPAPRQASWPPRAPSCAASGARPRIWPTRSWS